ncbi:MAG: hypothetical protein ACRD0Q_12295 [Acidimicrobiales bacterium]
MAAFGDGRSGPAMAAAAGVAALGGLLLGEYAFDGLAVIGAGVVLGLFVSEAAVAVAKHRTMTLAAACSLFTVLGLLMAAWISTGHRLGAVGLEGFLALVAGAAAAGLRARPLRGTAPRTPADNPPGSEPAG